MLHYAYHKLLITLRALHETINFASVVQVKYCHPQSTSK